MWSIANLTALTWATSSSAERLSLDHPTRFMFNPFVGDEINHLLIDFSSKSQLSLVFFIFSLTSLRPPSTAPTRSSLMSPQISCQFLTSMKYLPFFRSISEIWWNDFLTLKVFKVQFFLHLTWQDSRLKFYNLKEDTGLNALSPQALEIEIDNQKIKCGFINHLKFPQTEYICVDIIVSDWDIGEGAEPSVWIFQHSAKGHPAEWWLRLGMIGMIMNLLFVCLLDHRASSHLNKFALIITRENMS